MGASGCVAWMFDKKGVLAFPKDEHSDEELLEIGLEAGAEDIVDDGETWQIQCAPEDFTAVREAFVSAGIEPAESEITMIPQNTVAVDKETGLKLLKLYDALDENEDVQNVYANFDLPEELLAEMQD
jgi:transcriptional/translational regulatory protein YebC/TACO1